MTQKYDAIVIGTGQAAKPLTMDLASAGWKVAIIEKDLVGGSCINYGCTPTKTMVSCARVAHLAKNAGDYGVNVSDISIDMSIVKKKKTAIVATTVKICCLDLANSELVAG